MQMLPLVFWGGVLALLLGGMMRMMHPRPDIVHRLPYLVPGWLTGKPAATLVVQLQSGGLLVYSPGCVKDNGLFILVIGLLGKPEVVVVPSFLHCSCADDFQKAFPDATYIFSAGALNNIRCPLNATRVDYILSAEPRPRGDGFTVHVPEALEQALQDFAVYQYPSQIMELVLYHRPSGTLLHCDMTHIDPGLLAQLPQPTWQTARVKFGMNPGDMQPRTHTLIAADCPYYRCELPAHTCDDHFWGLAENCSNWKVDPVAMLRARQFLSTLALPGGVYNAHLGFLPQADWAKAMILHSGYLHRYELMARLSECANVSGAAMTLEPCDPHLGLDAWALAMLTQDRK